MSEEVGNGVPGRGDSQIKAEKKRRKLVPRNGERSNETGVGARVSLVGQPGSGLVQAGALPSAAVL